LFVSEIYTGMARKRQGLMGLEKAAKTPDFSGNQMKRVYKA
jgi:hypothetical protein